MSNLPADILLCAECFQDRGLRHMQGGSRPRSGHGCGAVSKHCLTRDDLLAIQTFLKGSTAVTDYGGGADRFQRDAERITEPDPPLAADVDLLNVLRIGFSTMAAAG
jgi:hypothetical protein